MVSAVTGASQGYGYVQVATGSSASSQQQHRTLPSALFKLQGSEWLCMALPPSPQMPVHQGPASAHLHDSASSPRQLRGQTSLSGLSPGKLAFACTWCAAQLAPDTHSVAGVVAVATQATADGSDQMHYHQPLDQPDLAAAALLARLLEANLDALLRCNPQQVRSACAACCESLLGQDS